MDEKMFDGREMLMLHDMFRREFGLMPALVRDVSATDVNRARIVCDHITLVTTFLHHHHQGEDTDVWPRLLQRCPADVAPIVATMESQHEKIALLDRDMHEALVVWRAGAHIGHGETLAVALENLTDLLAEHLALEERCVVPLMEEHITLAEWNQLIQNSGADVDPEALPLMFGLLMYEGAPDIVAATIGNMPPEIQPVIRDISANAFAGHSIRVHGTPTPARSTEL